MRRSGVRFSKAAPRLTCTDAQPSTPDDSPGSPDGSHAVSHWPHNLLLIRRFIAFCAVAAFLCFVTIAAAHPTAATPAWGEKAATPLTFGWSPQLAARFPDCRAHVSGVAASFVVLREDGRVQRLPFDLVWKWTHSDDSPRVWVVGQCAA